MDTKAGQIFIKNPKAPEEPPKTFSFDLVYDENVRQIDLYNEVRQGRGPAVAGALGRTRLPAAASDSDLGACRLPGRSWSP